MNAVEDVLHVETVIGAAVSSISEWLELDLTERMECICRCDMIDDHGVHRSEQRRISLAMRVAGRKKDECLAAERFIVEKLMHMHAEAIKEGDVEWTPVFKEAQVNKILVDVKPVKA